MTNSKKNGYILIAITVLIWSTSGLLVKKVEADPLWITLIRSLGGGLFLLPYVFKQKIFPLKNLFFAAVFMAIFMFSLTFTTRNSSSAMAISMQYTAPMYVIAYSFYKNKKIVINKLIVFMLIFVGIIFNVMSSLKGANNIAVVSGIIIGLSFVFYSVNLQKIKSGNTLGIVALINLFSAAIYGIVIAFNFTPPPTNIGEIGVLTVAGIIISGVSYALYGSSLRMISMEAALIICLAEPILNPLWVYLGKGEIPSLTTVIGVILILLGAIVDIFSSGNSETEEEQEEVQQ